MEKSEFERRILLNLDIYVQQNTDINDFLVKLIERAGSYLNLQTVSDYAKFNKISYNGVRKCRNVRELFNVKFVIDNK